MENWNSKVDPIAWDKYSMTIIMVMVGSWKWWHFMKYFQRINDFKHKYFLL